jgi:hypothetical protein
MLLVTVCLQVLMFLGLRIGGSKMGFDEGELNIFFSLLMSLGVMFVLFVISYQLYKENITNYYKILLPVKNTAFIVAPLLFWFICLTVSGFYLTGIMYVSSFIYDNPSKLQEYLIDIMMFDHPFVFFWSQIDFLIKSSVYLLLLFFSYTLMRLGIKGKKLRACMMGIILIAFIVVDTVIANWILKFVPAYNLGEKSISFNDNVEIVSHDFNIVHLFLTVNLCMLLIYSTSYLLKIRKDI